MLSFRSSWSLGLVVLAFGCAGSVETIPAENQQDNDRERESDDFEEPVEASGGTSSERGSGGQTSEMGSGGEISDADGPVGGGSGIGAIVGEFHFSFAGPPYSDSSSNGVQTISLVPRPENATVRAHLDNAEIVTGVAGSMVFLLRDCEELTDRAERCVLDIVSFGASASSMGMPGEYPYDGRLTTFAKQETFTTTVVREGGAFRLPPTDLGLILDVGTVQGTTLNLNVTGSGPDFITLEMQTGTSKHELWIESFEVACDGDSCEVEFSAYERDASKWEFECNTCDPGNAKLYQQSANCEQSSIFITSEFVCHGGQRAHVIGFTECDEAPPCAVLG